MMYTKEELLKMPLNRLRLVDVPREIDEKTLQEVVSKKMSEMPPQMEVSRIDVPDIKSKEQELEWQKIIDERSAKLKPTVSTQSAPIEAVIKEKEAELKVLSAELGMVKCQECGKEMKEKGLKMHMGKFHKNT